MADLEIIGAPQSTCVRAVRMACEEKGVAYALRPARPHSPEVDAIHPFGKVPVMRHGEFTLFESKAIATYIDRSFPGAKIIPDDVVLCAKVEQWVSAFNTAVFPILMTYMRNYFFPSTADGQPDRAAIEGVLPEVQSRLSMLDKAVAETKHLVGHGFTYADMNMLPALAYLRELPESGKTIAEAQNLRAYFKLHSERESFVNTIPPPFSELRR